MDWKWLLVQVESSKIQAAQRETGVCLREISYLTSNYAFSSPSSPHLSFFVLDSLAPIRATRLLILTKTGIILSPQDILGEESKLRDYGIDLNLTLNSLLP